MNPVAARLQLVLDLFFAGKQIGLAHLLGVTPGTASRWLTGSTTPDYKSLHRLSELGINPGFVFGSNELFENGTRGERARENAAWNNKLRATFEEFLKENASSSGQSNATTVGDVLVRKDERRRRDVQQILHGKIFGEDVGEVTIDSPSIQDVVIPMFESSIPAGYKVPIYEDLATSFNVTQYYKDCFTMRVRGDSMEGSGILDGDRVIIKRGHRFRNGDIIAAAVDGEVTLKGIWTKDSKLYLVPANNKYPIMEIPEEAQFECLGVCIDTFRPPKKVEWRER